MYSSLFHGYIDLELNFLVIFFSTYIVKQILKNSSTLSSKASPLHTKSYFFLFYTPIFTKHQFIYSTHLCNKNLFFYNFLLFSPSLPSLPHWPNTQRKVAVVFVSVRASLFSSESGSDGLVIEMASLLRPVFLCSS